MKNSNSQEQIEKYNFEHSVKKFYDHIKYENIDVTYNELVYFCRDSHERAARLMMALLNRGLFINHRDEYLNHISDGSEYVISAKKADVLRWN